MHGATWRELKEQGFVAVPGVLTEAGVAAFRAQVEALFEAAGENAGHEFQRDAFVRRVAADARLEAEVRASLGGAFVAGGVSVWSLHPHVPMEVALEGEGFGAALLLDDTVTGDGAVEVEGTALPGPAGSLVAWGAERRVVWRPNGTGRHIRMLRAQLRGAVAGSAYTEELGLPQLSMPRFYTRSELVEARAEWRRAGRKVVFTNGCYDILHPGHIRLLEAARALGDVLVLALNSDASVSRIKGPLRPLLDERQRAAVALQLEAVDAVVLFDEDTPRELIAAVLPDVLVKGADWSHFVAGREEVEAAGGEVRLLPLEPGYSTTATVEEMLARRRGTANS